MNALVIPTLKPKTHAQVLKEAAQLRDKVCAALEAHGDLSVHEIVEKVGSTPNRIRDCLYLMKCKGLVSSVLVVGYKPGAPVSAIYSLGAEEDSSGGQFNRQIRKTYPRNEICDPYHLPAEFFASAQQRNEQ